MSLLGQPPSAAVSPSGPRHSRRPHIRSAPHRLDMSARGGYLQCRGASIPRVHRDTPVEQRTPKGHVVSVRGIAARSAIHRLSLLASRISVARLSPASDGLHPRWPAIATGHRRSGSALSARSVYRCRDRGSKSPASVAAPRRTWIPLRWRQDGQRRGAGSPQQLGEYVVGRSECQRGCDMSSGHEMPVTPAHPSGNLDQRATAQVCH